MKKYLLIAITIFTITIAYSQTEKGKKLVGGQFNINGYNGSSGTDWVSYSRKGFGYQIVPSFGYFIKNNFAIGLNLNYGASDSSLITVIPNQIPSILTIKNNTVSYSAGGFARYYKKIVDSLFFTANIAAFYSFQSSKQEYSNNNPNNIYSASSPPVQETQTKGITFAISPGLVYFMTPKLGITTSFSSIYYSNSSSQNISITDVNHNDVSNYGFNLSVTTFYLGINYNF